MVSKQKMVIKTAKNQPIQTNHNDTIQSRIVRQKIHSNRSFLSIHQNLPQLRTHTPTHTTKHTRMDMPTMWKTPPKRHQRRHKHKKRRIKNNIRTRNTNKNINNYEPISQWEITW